MLKLRQILLRQVVGLGEGLVVRPIQVMTLQLVISTANFNNVMTKFIINKRTDAKKTDVNLFLTTTKKNKMD